MPVDPISLLAELLAGHLFELAKSYLDKRIGGAPAQRALQRVYARAFTGMLRRCAGHLDVEHQHEFATALQNLIGQPAIRAQLLDMAFASDSSGSPVSDSEQVPAVSLQSALHSPAFGMYDVDPEEALLALITGLEEGLTAEAAEANSPLANYVIVMRQRVTQLREQQMLLILRDLQRHLGQSHFLPKPKGVPFTAPTMEDNYVTRPLIHERLRERLLAGNGPDPCKGTIVVQGGPGFGKTTLAKAICYDADVQESYSRGILWVTFGETGRSALTVLEEMVQALGIPESFRSASAAYRRLCEIMMGRDVLLVFDDVWDPQQIADLPGPDLCTRLITTRVGEVALLDSSGEFLHIGEMQPEEAIQTLINWLPETLRDTGEPERNGLRKLARRLGEWPLMLQLFGRGLRSEIMLYGCTLAQALEVANRGLDEAGLQAYDETTEGTDRNRALEASMRASLRRFTEEERLRLYELAIFREDDDIPEQVARRLWAATAGLPEFQARRLLRRFAWQFFDLRTRPGDLAPALRCHDRIREYLQEQLGSERVAEAHRALLCSYNTQGRPWPEVGDDGYLYDHLTYHLQEAGTPEQMLRLLDDDRWMAVRFAQSGYTYTGFIEDVMDAWRWAEAEALQQMAGGRLEAEHLGHCTRCALIRSSINSLAANYAPALVIRAVDSGLWSEKRALAVANAMPNPWKRFDLLTSLYPRLEGDLKQTTLDGALQSVLQVRDEDDRTEALASLAPYLRSEDSQATLRRALAGALHITDAEARAKALVALVPCLPGEERQTILDQALESALGIGHEWLRARALAALAPHLRGEMLQQALQNTLNIGDEWGRAWALAALAPNLQGDERQEILGLALQTALRSDDKRLRPEAWAALAPYLSSQERQTALDQALQSALQIEREQSRARALAVLVPQLQGEMLQLALEGALLIVGERERAEALAALAPYLRGEMLQQALQAALSMGKDWARGSVLAALVPRLQDEMLEQALQSALQIRDEWWRTKVLVALAPHLRDEMLQQALESALTIAREWLRVETLVALVPRLQGGEARTALDCALQGALRTGEWLRARALAVPASYLDGEMLQRALQGALRIGDDKECVEALAALAPRLGDEERQPILEQALQSTLRTSEWSRAEALAALAPHLQDGMLRQALHGALQIEHEEERAKALAALAPYLQYEEQQTTLGQALQGVLQIEYEWDRARALAVLAPHLPPEMLQQALQNALKIGDEDGRAEALTALAPRLRGEERQSTLEQALQNTLRIGDEGGRARLLEKLGPLLQGEMVRQALQSALQLRDGEMRAIALGALVPCLQGEERETALNRALQVDYESERATALEVLAPYLEGEMLQQALQSALQVEYEGYRARALVALVPHLHGEMLQQALQGALQTEDEQERARVLAVLAPHLSDEAFQQALQNALLIVDPRARCEVLTIFAKLTGRKDLLLAARQSIVAALRYLEVGPRWVLLDLLKSSPAVGTPVLSEPSIVSMAKQITDICDHWSWQ